MSTTNHKIGIVIPTLNEAENIERLLDQVQLGIDKCSIYVVDGGSNDGTQRLVERLGGKHTNLFLVLNPQRIQSAGINKVVLNEEFDHDIFVRVDAHCDYPEGYVFTIVDLLKSNKADTVVVPMRTVHRRGGFQKAAAAAQNSILGNGGSAHRSATTRSGWTEHGHHAGFKTAKFKELGGYDASFATNEDAEFDLRVIRSGGRIWLAGDVVIDYFPRDNFDALAKQYFAYGTGRAQTIKKHQVRPALRQLAPAVVTAGVFGSIIAWPIFALLGLTALELLAWATPFVYAGSCLAAGWLVSKKSEEKFLTKERLYVGFAAIGMHMNWGAGFLKEIAFGRKFSKTKQPKIGRL